MSILSESKVDKNKIGKIGELFGLLFSFNSSLKLHHWNITGVGSYATHMALDQAIGDLLDVTDTLVETSIAIYGNLDIIIPETKDPGDIISYCEKMYHHVDSQRTLFEGIFFQSIIDEYQTAITQLLYRLKRLQ